MWPNKLFSDLDPWPNFIKRKDWLIRMSDRSVWQKDRECSRSPGYMYYTLYYKLIKEALLITLYKVNNIIIKPGGGEPTQSVIGSSWKKVLVCGDSLGMGKGGGGDWSRSIWFLSCPIIFSPMDTTCLYYNFEQNWCNARCFSKFNACQYFTKSGKSSCILNGSFHPIVHEMKVDSNNPLPVITRQTH